MVPHGALALARRMEARDLTGNPTDGATATLHDEMQITLGVRQLAEVQAALERLHRGEYRFCHECDDFTELTRLQALPFPWRSTPYQRRVELTGRALPRLARCVSHGG